MKKQYIYSVCTCHKGSCDTDFNPDIYNSIKELKNSTDYKNDNKWDKVEEITIYEIKEVGK